MKGMNFLKLAEGAFKRALKSPMIVSIAIIIGVLYAYLDFLNPVPGLVVGFATLGGDWLGVIISAIQFVTNISLIGRVAVIAVISLLIVAFALGVFMSGYMSLLKNVIEASGQRKGSFLYGLKNNLGRSIKISFYLVFASIFFVVFIVISLIPSLFTGWTAFNGNPRLVPISIMISVVTVFTLFFIIMFFLAYTIFWNPISTRKNKNFVKESKRLADLVFWALIGKLILYVLSIIAFMVGIQILKYAVPDNLGQNNYYLTGVYLFEIALAALLFMGYTSFSMGAYLDSLKIGK